MLEMSNMETGNNSSNRKKVIFITVLSVVTVLVLYYTVMAMMSPAKKLAQIKNEFGAKATEKDKADLAVLMDAEYLSKLKEKSFLQSRVVMAQTDSIYMTINLADSTVNLEICGVVVHRAKMSEFKASRILMADNENAVISMLAKPFSIVYARSTIKKEPVMIKVAPKDTSEYKPDIMPDTSITEPVNYILQMDDGFRIYVYQAENVNFDEKMNQFKFDLTDRLTDTWKSLKSVAVFKVPEYHPYIKIKIPRSDAKIIYRAIPKNGQIAIFS
jgi:hypothetical protein